MSIAPLEAVVEEVNYKLEVKKESKEMNKKIEVQQDKAQTEESHT